MAKMPSGCPQCPVGPEVLSWDLQWLEDTPVRRPEGPDFWVTDAIRRHLAELYY